MVFMGVILQTTPRARKAKNSFRSITRRLDQWDIRQYAALCSDSVAENRLHPKNNNRDNEETEARTSSMALYGNPSSVSRVRGRAGSCFRGCRHNDLKSGHGSSERKTPSIVNPKYHRPIMFLIRGVWSRPKCRDSIPLRRVHKVGWKSAKMGRRTKCSECTGLSDLAAPIWTSSESLRKKIAAWTYWNTNESPPWAAYHTITAVRIVTL